MAATVNRYKVLIVDDLYINRILLSEIVEEAGCIYKLVQNGKQAIEALDKEHFDVVLLDIEMPIMNGFETVRHIRQKMKTPTNKIFVVAITAHDPNTFMDEYKNSGFNELISKPYNVDKIKKMLTKIQ